MLPCCVDGCPGMAVFLQCRSHHACTAVCIAHGSRSRLRLADEIGALSRMMMSAGLVQMVSQLMTISAEQRSMTVHLLQYYCASRQSCNYLPK